MIKRSFLVRYSRVFLIAFLLASFGVSCLPEFATPAPQTVLQTVVVTREVTREVTRVVKMSVTDTPTRTPYITDTPTQTPTLAATPTSAASPTNAVSPTITGTRMPPAVTVLIHTQCRYGPDAVYLGRYEIQAASPQAVIGRSADSTWLYLKGVDHKNPCWLKAEQVRLEAGSLADVPVTDPVLSPYSTLYPPPQVVSTFRAGGEITIFWQPVPVAEADYRGYLVETWVCQGGKLLFDPVSYVPAFNKNTSMLAVKVTDEPGCLEPSSARIYTVNNQGYSAWKQVPWQPAALPTSTGTLTPTP